MKHTKIPVALVMLVTLSACGSKGAGKQEEPQPKTISEAIAYMKKKGDLPSLDHSTSVAGDDKDGNGVRDDMDAYINSLPYTAAQKAALSQESKAIQSQMTATNLTDVNALNAINKQSMRGVFCVNARYDDYKLADNMVRKILHYTVNTKERLDAYLAYSSAVNGFTMSSPEGNPCDQ